MSSDLSVVVSDLSVVHAKRGYPVVQGVDFEIERGKVLGLVGESGSGKSTVGVALLGKARKGLRIASGKVVVNGTDILVLPESKLRSVRGRVVAYVPQDPTSGLNPALRVGSQLSEALKVHADTEPGLDLGARMLELLEEVALPASAELLRKYPHQLSGGQQQRIGIAMAYAWRPALVVLDEPTTGLDVTTQKTILDTVRRLSSSHGVSAVYVSHDLPVVAQIADETAVMYAGRIVERARGATLFSAPRHPYTAGLIAAAPSPDESQRLVGIEGRPPRPGAWPAGCAFADRCERAVAACRQELPAWQESADGGLRCWVPLTGWTAPRPEPRSSGVISTRQGALEVRSLNAHYNGHAVLRDVSLTLPAGKCTAIVGESGSGKTTLARCIVGLHSACEGSIELDGAPLAIGSNGRSDVERRRMQYVFQNPYASLNPKMSVAENLAEPLRHFERLSAADRRSRVITILDRVALSSAYADRMPDQLSGGERQRVAVGRALIVNPNVLVCDEVTSALDVSVQALLVEQLRELQEQSGLSMLFITHNLAVVRSIADRVVVLAGGRVMESGTAHDVLNNPTSDYTRGLLSDLPRFPGETGGKLADPAVPA